MRETLERKRKTKSPCSGCGLGPALCICESIPKLSLPTRLALVIHAKELKRTTNSGTLALKALTNSVLRTRGADKTPVDLTELLDPDYQSVLFYPALDAVELTSEFVKSFAKPIQLIVPDGNWRQAGKVHTRHPELARLPRVVITTPNLATQHLRKESSEFGMSTLEAIARAFKIIEGDEVGDALLKLYQSKLRATLIGRGEFRQDQR